MTFTVSTGHERRLLFQTWHLRYDFAFLKFWFPLLETAFENWATSVIIPFVILDKYFFSKMQIFLKPKDLSKYKGFYNVGQMAGAYLTLIYANEEK